MADLAGLSYFQVDQLVNGLVADTLDVGYDPDVYNVWMSLEVRPRVEGAPELQSLRLTSLTPPRTLILTVTDARIETGVLKLPRLNAPSGETSPPTTGQIADQQASPGLRLLAHSAALGIGDRRLLYDFVPGETIINGRSYRLNPFTIAAPDVDPATYDTTNPPNVDLTTAPRVVDENPSFGSGRIVAIPDRVRLNGDGEVVFSAGGVDIPDPLSINVNAGPPPSQTVDEYREYPNVAAFPNAGVADRIYVAVDTGKFYRWNGSGYVLTSDTDVAAVTHAAPAKTAPADADELLLADSAASFAARRVTVADLRTAVKPPPRPIMPSLVVGWGDSISGFGGQGINYSPLGSDMYLHQLCGMSRQRMKYGGYFYKAGRTLAQLRAEVLPQVLDLDPAPGWVILFGGTNDKGLSVPFADSKASLKATVADLRARGINPILVTVPPNTLTSPSVAPAIIQWNRWIRHYAGINGFPVLDAYRALAGPDGGWKDPAYTYDGLHPSALGHYMIAMQGIADGLPGFFPPGGQMLTCRSSTDLSNLFNNGTINLGTFDTGNAGVATGLIKFGNGTATLVNPNPADDLMGRWQQIAGVGGFVSYPPPTGWSVDDQLALSARIQTDNVVTSKATWTVIAQSLGNYTINGHQLPAAFHGWYQRNTDAHDSELYTKFPVLPTTTEIYLYLMNDAVNGDGIPNLRVGELSLVNLTTGEILV